MASTPKSAAAGGELVKSPKGEKGSEDNAASPVGTGAELVPSTGDPVLDMAEQRRQEVGDLTHLPSPERRTVFVFHETYPDGIARITLPPTWEIFIELIESRLKLRSVVAVMDSVSGAVIDELYELRDGDRLAISGYLMPEEEVEPKYFGEDSIFGYNSPGSNFRVHQKSKVLTGRQDLHIEYRDAEDITHSPDMAPFGTGIESIDSPSKAGGQLQAVPALTTSVAGTPTARSTARSGVGTPTSALRGTARSAASAGAGSGHGGAALGDGEAADDEGQSPDGPPVGKDGKPISEALAKRLALAKLELGASDADLMTYPEGHPFAKLRASKEILRAFGKKGKSKPPDSLHIIRTKRYQTLRERGLEVTVASIGDILAAMIMKPECKNVATEGCQALRDALVRPCDYMTYDSDPVANSVAEQGAIPLVASLLRRHMENVGVVEQALAVFSQISAVHDKDLNAVVNTGAISLAVAALREHETHCGIQEQGLGLLATISRTLPNARAVREQGGEDVARKALESFSDRRGVYENGGMVLDNCARLDRPKFIDTRPYYER